MLSKLTANGETTIPQAVRTALDLQDGDHLRYIIEGHSVRLIKLSRAVVSQEHATLPEKSASRWVSRKAIRSCIHSRETGSSLPRSRP